MTKAAAKSSTSAVRTTESYAERVKMNQQQNKNNQTNINEFINSQIKMMSEFMATMIKIQKQFISTFGNKNGQ